MYPVKMPEPRQIVPVLLCLVTLAAAAQSIGERMKNLVNPGDDSFSRYGILDPDQAFRLSAKPLGRESVRFTWVVEEGYYLYRDKFSFVSLADDVRIDQTALLIPRGKVKQDESFGEVEVNTGLIVVDAPLVPANAGISNALFQVGYQGCKEGSVCYPPQQREIAVDLEQTLSATVQPVSRAQLSVQDRITARLKQGSFVLNVLAFFAFGALLSLTPCVFPMIPILSGIIVGQSGTVTGRRGFLLSLPTSLPWR